MVRILLALLLVFGPGMTLPGVAQEAPLTLQVQGGDGSARVILGEVLSGSGVEQSLESGLPLRISVVVELWRDRFVDALEGRHDWRATILQDPLTDRFRVETGDGGSVEVASLASARAFLQSRLAVPLAPDREGRFYYLARLEVETLSLSDLEELRRWLRGDVGAAVEGGEEVGGVLGRGLRRLLVRALGLPVQRYQTRSEVFRH